MPSPNRYMTKQLVLDFYRGQNSKMESDEQMPETTLHPVS
jgi:hypothetical protein